MNDTGVVRRVSIKRDSDFRFYAFFSFIVFAVAIFKESEIQIWPR